jgi:hypothetical protein
LGVSVQSENYSKCLKFLEIATLQAAI